MAHRKLSQSLLVNAVPFLAAGVAVAASSASEPTRRAEQRPPPQTSMHHPAAQSQPLLILDAKFCSVADLQRRLGRMPTIGWPHSLRAICEGKDAASESEPERFQRALALHRSRIALYRQQWEYSADSSATTSTKTPSRSWPDDVPSNDDLSWLLEDVKYCHRSPNFRSDKEYCSRLAFRVAAALLVQFDDESQEKGLAMLRALAENGYADAMVYYGTCLNEGRAGKDPNSNAAVCWFKRCSDMYEHPQSLYELGVSYYTGEGVAEDEEEAVRLFQLASEKDHPAACYMLGDCLLDGIGAEVDRGAALEWLVRAAELGHRGARSRVMAVLEKKEGDDYGGFTDASRQTMVEHIVHTADKSGKIVRCRTTLRREIGGGSRNPTELARRQTIVAKSRKDS